MNLIDVNKDKLIEDSVSDENIWGILFNHILPYLFILKNNPIRVIRILM